MRITSRFLAGATGLALALTPAMAFATPNEPTPAPSAPASPPPSVVDALLEAASENPTDAATTARGPVTAETQKVMVLITGQPTGPGNELARLAEVQELAEKWSKTYNLKVDRSFGYLVKGFSAQIPTDQIAKLQAEPQVKSVQPVRTYYPVMETAAELTQSVTARTAHGVDGAGIVVSIIDTGIDISHQDMRLDEGVATKLAPEAGFTAKVPFGYNYADENGTVVDTTASQHGMHVAGIVAANGGEDASVASNGRINGIAPNAQLLAMKVFSNDPSKGSGAAGDDIIAAIEDSVKHGADVINMSLGASNGLVSGESGEQRAIINAVNAGVEVIVAAGNEGLSSSANGTTDDNYDRLDDGAVGTPSTGEAAVSVASVNNSSAVQTVARANIDGENKDLSYRQQAGTRDDEAHTLVYAELGKPEQVPDAVKGNWALIERGEISFADKVKNAVAKGATGVIIYNHANGGDEIPGMAGVDEFTQVVAGMGHTDGQLLADALKAGKKVTLTLTEDRKLVAMPNALQPSDFTSWGSTSDLSFKPQLAGIGGNVYSTLNNNDYGMMSGTSMASPHVAGVAALLREQFSQKFPGLSGTELTDQIRVALANTAKVLTNEANVPFSARQMGAGLVQTNHAMNTSVFATVDGSPWVELKDFTAAQSRTITLRNASDQDRTFKAGGTCVVNESNGDGAPVTTSCSAGDTLSVDVTDVTVPANGQTQVSFTVTPGSTEKHWVSGWVQFESQDSEQPSLSVPYLGFVGNWNEEPIIDTPIYNTDETPYLTQLLGEENQTVTSLVTKVGSFEVPMAPGKTVISPNGDGLKDTVFPSVAVLRNAREMEVSVLDKNGEVVRKLGSERNVSRHMLSTYLEKEGKSLSYALSANRFDGTKWDPQQAEFVNVPDGDYTMRVASTLSKEWNPQVVDMPFTIDTVAPTLEIVSVSEANAEGAVTIRVKVADNVALNPGISVIAVGSDAGPLSQPKPVAGSEGTFDLDVPNAASMKYVRIQALDLAGNTTLETVFLGEGALLVSQAGFLNGAVINDSSISPLTDEPLITDGKITLTGTVHSDVVKVRVSDVEVDVKDRSFTVQVPVGGGENTVLVEALKADESVAESTELTFTVDNQAPVLTITNPDPSKPAELAADGTLTIEGTVSDDLAKIASVRIAGEDVPVTDGKFTATITPDPSVSSVVVSATDGVNVVTQVIALARPADTSKNLKLDANADPARAFNFVEPDSPDVTVEGDKHIFNFHGTFNRVPQEFSVDGKVVEVAPDGSFSTPIELQQGITSVNVRIVDVDGRVTFDSALKILFDSKVPGLDLTEPTIHPDGVLYRKDTTAVKFAGKVWDNAFGYSLTLNGDVVEHFFDIDDPKPEANVRDFSADVKIADGDRILLGLYDQVGNAYLQLIPVIIDALAPELTFEGVKNGDVVPSSQVIKVIAKDTHLDSLQVNLDGVEVNTVYTQVVPANGAETLVKGEPDPGFNPPTSGGANVAANTASDAATPAAEDGSDKDATLSKAELEAVAAKDVEEKATPVEAAAENTGEGYTVLTVELDRPLAAGYHELSATALDKAGNRTDEAVTFLVNDAPVIEGPDSLTVYADGDVDQQIRDAFKVIDDQDEDLQLSFDSSILVEGETVTLRLTATDSMGLTGVKDVQVTLLGASDEPVPGEPTPVPPVPGEPGPVVPGPVDPTDLPSNPADKVTPRPTAPKMPVTGTQAGTLAVIAAALAAGGLGLVVARRGRERS